MGGRLLGHRSTERKEETGEPMLAETRKQTLAKEGLSHPTPQALVRVAADTDDIEQSVFWHPVGPQEQRKF